jgi:putative transposase
MAVAANQTNRRCLDGHYTSLSVSLLSVFSGLGNLVVALVGPLFGLGSRLRLMRIRHAVPAKVARVVRDLPSLTPLSPDARRRLRWFDYYRSHGQNVSLTCRHFGIARNTFYTWKRRYDPSNLASLEDRSSKPKHPRTPTWSLELAQAVLALRDKYPSWGKDKLVVLLRREDRWKDQKVSTSMVGRILRHLKNTRQLSEPKRFAISVRKRRHKRAYAVRKPKDYSVKAPGDLVAVDTPDVRHGPNVVRKQFTARDLISRWDVLDIRSTASAKTAAEFIDALLERMPFEIKAIQVDNGSEFMAEFEESCQQKQIQLFVLPPRSPKLNGAVERAQRTHTEEHWELSTCDTEVEPMRADLRDWEHTYNTIRPHQALDYKTPLEYVTLWKQQQNQPSNQVV